MRAGGAGGLSSPSGWSVSGAARGCRGRQRGSGCNYRAEAPLPAPSWPLEPPRLAPANASPAPPAPHQPKTRPGIGAAGWPAGAGWGSNGRRTKPSHTMVHHGPRTTIHHGAPPPHPRRGWGGPLPPGLNAPLYNLENKERGKNFLYWKLWVQFEALEFFFKNNL